MAGLGLSTNGESIAMLDLPVVVSSLSVEEQLVELFSEMRTPLLRHLVWLNLSPDQAEDIVQETFLRLFEHLSRAEFERRNLRGWVWKVAHNLGLNLRTTANRQEKGRELALNDVLGWLADSGPNPEQMYQQRQSGQMVEKGLLQLDERDKQCFHLRAQGLGYRQIALVLGIGRSTVADTLERVTLKLRRSYSHL